MEPGEALSTAAQIAVTLAGFAGVVVVFRSGSVHDWTPIDKFRLRLLLANSILPLALCVIGLLLLTIKPPVSEIWRWCSRNCFAVRDYGIQELSPSRSAAVAERACCRVAILSVQHPGNRRDAAPVLQHRHTQRILAVLHRHHRAFASRHNSVRKDYPTST